MAAEQGEMQTAVRAALAGRTGPVDPRNAGVEQLAIHYAQLVDDAQPAAKYVKPLRQLAIAVSAAADEDGKIAEAYDTIRTALAAHSVASDLGPKLLAALDALGLTPKARTAGKEAPGGQPKPANPLDELRARRAARGG